VRSACVAAAAIVKTTQSSMPCYSLSCAFANIRFVQLSSVTDKYKGFYIGAWPCAKAKMR
jgi:hypothetical protein